ncbi:MAG: ribonuclease HI family protein [Terriglobales bacterium]
MTADFVIHVDGGSRGNPGPAGYGVVICDPEGAVLDRIYASVGHQTNNFAEYSGLLAALRYAIAHGAKQVRILADSQLLVRQMEGRYAVKSPNLRPLFAEARRLALQIPSFSLTHVYREQNREADRLANLAMDGK